MVSAAETLIPLPDVCVAHLVDLEHARAMIRAGRLPAPELVREDGAELVAPNYLPNFAAPPAARSPIWRAHVEREARRFTDAQRRLIDSFGTDPRWTRERQLVRMGTAAWGVGLSLLMDGLSDESREWFDRCARSYRFSLATAPSGNWGRSIGAIKSRLLCHDDWGAQREARLTLELGAVEAQTPIPSYAACLADLVLGEYGRGLSTAQRLLGRPDFPQPAARSLVAIAALDASMYDIAIRELLQSFESRNRYLESIPAGDTVVAFQRLARRRGLCVPLKSHVLPTEA